MSEQPTSEKTYVKIPHLTKFTPQAKATYDGMTNPDTQRKLYERGDQNAWVGGMLFVGDPDSVAYLYSEDVLSYDGSLAQIVSEQAFTTVEDGTIIGARAETYPTEKKSPFDRFHDALKGPMTLTNVYKSIPIIEQSVDKMIDSIKQVEIDSDGTINIKADDFVRTMAFEAMMNTFYTPDGIAPELLEKVPEKIKRTLLFPLIANFLTGLPVNKLPVIGGAVESWFRNSQKDLFGLLKEALGLEELDVKVGKIKFGKDINRATLFEKLIKDVEEGLINPENGQPYLSVQEFIGITLALFSAGHETTTNAFKQSILDIYSQKQKNSPDYQRLMKEINDLPDPSSGPEARKKYEDYIKDNGSMLALFLAESKRIVPPLNFFPVVASKDFEMPTKDSKGNVVYQKVKKGTQISIAQGMLQMNEKLFANPNEFNPSRFERYDNQGNRKVVFGPDVEGLLEEYLINNELKANTEELTPQELQEYNSMVEHYRGLLYEKYKFAYSPFAEALKVNKIFRVCLGMNFAKIEERIALIKFLKNFDVEAVNDTELYMSGGIQAPHDIQLSVREKTRPIQYQNP